MLTSCSVGRQTSATRPPNPVRTRKAAVAGSWYPSDPARLTEEVDRYLEAGRATWRGSIVAVLAPHAGLMYSGPVAAHSYSVIAGQPFDLAVLVGPSHYVGFDGVALPDAELFETPLGPMRVSRAEAEALLEASPCVTRNEDAHRREHSLEMQLPFLRRVQPDLPILPVLMGRQSRATIEALAGALASVLAGRRALLVASSDLSHYYDARTAATLDGRVIRFVERFDPEGLLEALEAFPAHACGGGPVVAVMLAARALGACDAAVLKYADSGDVSGDKSAVVGYLAAAFGRFDEPRAVSLEP